MVCGLKASCTSLANLPASLPAHPHPQAVLAGASGSREGTLCCQAVFALLDTLQKWHGDAKAAAQKEAQSSRQTDQGACLLVAVMMMLM